MFCTECGHKFENSSKFCPQCGTAIDDSPPDAETSAVHAPNPVALGAPPPTSGASSAGNNVLILAPVKSVGTAILLAVVFGPLGLLYASVTGGIVMLFISVILGIFTLGASLFITWPICVIWAAVAVNSHNAALMGKIGNGDVRT